MSNNLVLLHIFAFRGALIFLGWACWPQCGGGEPCFPVIPSGFFLDTLLLLNKDLTPSLMLSLVEAHFIFLLLSFPLLLCSSSSFLSPTTLSTSLALTLLSPQAVSSIPSFTKFFESVHYTIFIYSSICKTINTQAHFKK